MPPQSVDWTCSACSLAWVLRSTAMNTDATEWDMVEAIGTPTNINPTYGLMDGSGSQLQRVCRDYHLNSAQGWLTFDQVYAIANNNIAMMSGGNWYHWVGVRGRSDNNLWIANSAPGYRGIYDILSRDNFNSLGPFSVVWITEYI